MSQSLTIGQLASEAGVGVETIRFYERRGLIADPPRRPSSGYRDYPQETVRRLKFIRRAKNLGFSLQEIGELLALRTGSAALCGEVREQIANKLENIERRTRALQQMSRALTELHDLCEITDPRTECPILDLLDEQEPDV